MGLLNYIDRFISRRNSNSLIKYYRKRGITIGDNCIFRSPKSTSLDLMRPSLISIGNDVDMNSNFKILTHDFSHKVFVPLYGEFLSSSGKVCIGNNVYFGTNVTILKGVTIGDNCIIGAGSLVTKDIPSNSVAAGLPCKVICTIEEYYKKRLTQWENEAIEYAKSIKDVLHRNPTEQDFIPEFGLYIDSSNIETFDKNKIKKRLKDKYEYWLKHHKAKYKGFDDFLNQSVL